MNRRILALIMTFCLVLLCGCNKSNSQAPQTSSKIGGSLESGVESSTESNTLVFEDFVGEYPENPIPILTMSEDEIHSVIDAQSNLKCEENLYINIPESATVYEYSTYGVQVPQFEYTGDQFRKDFETTFKYLFPDKELDMECFRYSKLLYYDYENWEPIFEKGYVKDKESLPDKIELTYNEKNEGEGQYNFPVYMSINIAIGGGNGVIDKGEAATFAKDVEEGTIFEPDYYFESVGKYTPQSEKSFNLLDGEMKICDAVKFVENYLNNIPISIGLPRNVSVHVYCVEVLQIGDGVYGYFFHTEERFQGVNYDPVVYGMKSTYDYDASGGEAFMIRSDDVDYIHCIFGNTWTFDVNVCEEIITVDTAIKAISEKLSKRVEFEVLTVEFVYVRQLDKDEEGYIKIDTYEGRLTPAWRITVGCSNDDRTYYCYVDAADGGNFRYFLTPGITYYDD